METEVTRKLFTVDEFCRMGEAGIFGEESRLELIEGEILEMSAPGIRHVSCVNRASALFASRLAGKAMFSVQNPVLLSNDTMPQPDIVLARPRENFYSDRRITPADTVLVLEVSDTTLRYDRKRKMPLYAKWGVPELWIENLGNDVILVFRDPGPSGYATSITLHRGKSIALAEFPDVTFTVDELLG
jgi:Uma2 family endonuclease